MGGRGRNWVILKEGGKRRTRRQCKALGGPRWEAGEKMGQKTRGREETK